MHRFITRFAVGIMAAGVSFGLIATSGPAATAATHTRARSATTLPAGETVTHYADGRTLYTMAMKFAPKAGRAAGVRPDGFGQNPGDCGTAKLWTYAGSHQFQLSLIGNAGVFLGLGAYEFTTNGVGSLPVWGAIEGKGQTWTSGRMNVLDPGLFAGAAVVAGDDQTSEGNCIIAVGAIWN